MFVFRKIGRALFSWNTRFEIHPFALLPTIYGINILPEMFGSKSYFKKKSKVDVPRCFVNKLLLKISQNSQENTYITCIRPTFIKNQSLLGHSIQILYVEVICHQFVRATVPMVSFKISCDFCCIFHPILTQIFHFKANNYLQLH